MARTRRAKRLHESDAILDLGISGKMLARYAKSLPIFF
jgi:hypothetical protein